jgi:RNA-directed DNA polymerase
MSDYDFEERGEVNWTEPGLQSLFRHRAPKSSMLRDYKSRVRQLAATGDYKESIRSLSSCLLKLIAEPRVLFDAWTYLAAHGGQAPGPDHRRYADFSRSEVWALCKAISVAIRDGSYRPHPEKLKKIPKQCGTGERTLVLQNVADRVVQRAAFVVLQPLFDPLFLPESFGFRPGRGQLHAVAFAEHIALTESRTVWLAHDIRDAFEHVSISRLLVLLRSYLPCDELMTFLETIISSSKVSGLRQGGPLSPLMLNLYLHHVLDLPWRRVGVPGVILVRFADDLRCLCRDVDTAVASDRALRRLLRPTGMELKAPIEQAVCDLGQGAADKFLGFQVTLEDGELCKRIPSRSWQQLRRRLSLAHEKNDSQLRADSIVRGWLGSKGPTYPYCDAVRTCLKIHHAARYFAFEEVTSIEALQLIWTEAHATWLELREQASMNKSA